MSPIKTLSLILTAVVLWLLSMGFFIVDETELAVKFKFGEFERADYEPGLHWKIPFVNSVRTFDRRILTLDAVPARYLTSEKKNVIVDAFIKWRISDVSSYFKATSGDERKAGEILAQVINDGLRGEFGKRTIQEAISGERAEIMSVITAQIEEQATQFGIEVVDVRIKRIELPPEVSGSVYGRMEAERSRVAKDLRSRGREVSERIRADADRQRTVLLAEAYRDAERLRGEGDAKAAEIYAKAFQKDEKFYAFYRSIDAYRNVFSKQEDVLVLDPESEFFDYFKDDNGRRK
ncbi:MAG: protease modulator HflC [Chromatiales bacterium]|nr:protease modulator HflC [Chromatiales bacterium]